MLNSPGESSFGFGRSADGSSTNQASSSGQPSDDVSTGSLRETRCLKSPGHREFYPVKKLTAAHLPPPFCNDNRWVEMLLLRSADTVRIQVRYTSRTRPESTGWAEMRGTNRLRNGSGTAFWSEGLCRRPSKCPFQKCQQGGPNHKVYGPFYIVTVGHLVYNSEEAQAASVEFFYDEPDKTDTVCKAEVVSVSQGPVENNRCILTCITHDKRLPQRLEESRRKKNELLKQLKEPDDSSMVVLISHPHGCSKHISVGDLVQVHAAQDGPVKEVQRADGTKQTLRACTFVYSTPSCVGSGGGSITVWKKDQRAFAPHSSAKGNNNQSAMGWMTI